MPDRDGILLDPLPDRLVALHFQSRHVLVPDGDLAHLRPDLTHALERCDRLVFVAGVREPVRVDDGRDRGV